MANLKTITVAILSPVMNVQRPSIVVFAKICDTWREIWKRNPYLWKVQSLPSQRLRRALQW